ncbi:unnamed protein product [Porites evermanni]|uniref:Uncharacterized protein n=1 Tax=Porites evermanni TaxID=104178 RepID=A0ABN8LDU9_9CNID|nr:unnamed protein product [Porites evermanni]
MAPRETENNAYAKFGVTNKEHYGMLWYFSGAVLREQCESACFLCPLQCKTAREKRGSNLSSDGVFGEHLLKGKGKGEGDLQNKIFDII